MDAITGTPNTSDRCNESSDKNIRAYASQIEMAKNMIDMATPKDFGSKDFAETLKHLLVPPEYMNMNAEQTIRFLVDKEVQKYKLQFVETGKETIDIPSNAHSKTILKRIIEELQKDGYHCYHVEGVLSKNIEDHWEVRLFPLH